MVPPQRPSGQVDIYPGHRQEQNTARWKIAALGVQNSRESRSQKRLGLKKGRIPALVGKSVLHKSGQTAARLIPSVSHLDDISGRPRRFQTLEQHGAVR